MKYSRKREAIFEAIRSTDQHPNAEWIYAQLKPVFPDLSLGTVYRNIALFRQQGKIFSVATVNGQERYDAALHQHPHFICNICGSVQDIACTVLQEKPIEELEALLDVKIDALKINLYGRCRPCMQKECV